MLQPQPGIFALGTTDHAFLEFDLADSAGAADLVALLAGLTGPGTTIGGVNVTVGIRPELWAEVGAGDAPSGVRSFEQVRGPELTMPATQHDAWVWVAGGSRSAVFDSTRGVLAAVAGAGVLAGEVGGWLYRHDRDLTGFIDGTENPPATEAAEVSVLADGPGAGSAVLLYQLWKHLDTWAALPEQDQERVIGRTKPASVELDPQEMPPDSHVSRNVVEESGRELRIYRRNVAYGTPADHGTVFVGFCAEQRPLQVMLERMAGVGDGVRDALTRYTEPLTGAYYVVPPASALRRFLPADEG